MTSRAEPVNRPPIAALALGRPFDARWSGVATVVVGILAGLAIAYLIATGNGQMAIGAALAVPIAALVVGDPFIGVILWVLTVPYFSGLSAETGPVIWAVHRFGIPAVIVLTAVHSRLGWRRWGLRVGWVDLFLAAFIAIGLVNIVFLAPNTQRMIASFYDKMIVPIALFWLIRAMAPRRRELRMLVGAGLITLVTQSTIGLLSWVAPSVLPSAWLGRAGERTTGTLGGPAPFTITLVLFGIIAVHAAAQSPSVRHRAVMIGATLLAAVAIFLSLSRGSWLGAGIAFTGVALIHRRLVGLMAVIAVLTIVALSAGPLAEQVAFAQERIGDDDTVESRIVTNDASLRMIEAQPIIGFGFGNFERYDESFKRRVGDIPLKLGGSSHNTYLAMLAEQGIPATTLYLAVPVVLLATTFLRWRDLPPSGLGSRVFVAALWLAIIDMFVVQNFLEMIHSSYWATSLWWLTLGLIASVLDRADERRRFDTAVDR
ncbi:MAG: O-antigen ligase family protein [Chloroflexota bacterium]